MPRIDPELDKLHINRVIGDGTEGIASGDTLIVQYDDCVRYLGLLALENFSKKKHQSFSKDELYEWYLGRDYKCVIQEACQDPSLPVSRDVYDYFLLDNVVTTDLINSSECPIFSSLYTLLKSRIIRKLCIFCDTQVITEMCRFDVESSNVPHFTKDITILEGLRSIVDYGGPNGTTYICDISTARELSERCSQVSHVVVNGTFRYNYDPQYEPYKLRMKHEFSSFAYMTPKIAAESS